MFDLQKIQAALAEMNLDGWLLYDFRGSNTLARRILDLDGKPVGSRRFYYFIPRTGQPSKLVHRIETDALDHLPGNRYVYLRWQELESELARILAGTERLAMEYSARNTNPYVSRVDAGTIEVAKSVAGTVVSSGDLIQLFEATWDDDQAQSHFAAEKVTLSAFEKAWQLIAKEVRAGRKLKESQVQAEIMQHFKENGCVTSSMPIVAVGPHAGNPHYHTTPETDTEFGEGDFVLVDLWAKQDRPRSVYSDLTQVAFVGTTVPDKIAQVFGVVAQARDAAITLVETAFKKNRALAGYQVDQAARKVIDQAGYGLAFIHRTGHSIGQETHGNGANMDDLETHDERMVLRRTAFSIEPGIYLPDFGVRLEVNVFVDGGGNVHVTGLRQKQVHALLA